MYLTFAIYLIFILAITFFASQKAKSTESDVHLAGRKTPAIVTALSSAASTESGFVLLGMVGAGYSIGLSALWILPAGIIGYALLWIVLAKRVRIKSEKISALTLPEYLAKSSKNSQMSIYIGSIATIISVVFLLAYTSAQINAAGKAIEAQFEIGLVPSILVTSILIGFYISLGGFRASIWTDIPQALLMFIALVFMPLIAIYSNGGVQLLLESLHKIDPNLVDPLGGETGTFAIWGAVSWIVLGLAYPGQPHAVSRMMATEEKSNYISAYILSTSWFVILYFGAILMGCATRVWYSDIAVISADPEKTLPILASVLLLGIFGGVIVSAIFSAIASTADSTLSAASSIISRIIPSKFKFGSSRITFAIATIVLLGISTITAILETGLVFDLVLYAWAGLGATLGPSVLYVTFTNYPKPLAIITAMLIGGVSVLMIKNSSLSLLIGFTLANIVIWAIHVALSNITRKSGNAKNG